MFKSDEPKSRANLAKHGIDFVEDQQLWTDPDQSEIPAKTVDEHRLLFVGRIAGKYWSAVANYRSESVRLISVRRSRPEEVELYESYEVRQRF